MIKLEDFTTYVKCMFEWSFIKDKALIKYSMLETCIKRVDMNVI